MAVVAFLDFDNDGDQDLLFVNSSSWPWREPDPAAAAALYLNRGDGVFDQVEVGLAEPLYGMGVAVGDYDGDGYPDVFLSALGANRLYRNLEGKTFSDVTEAPGVAGDPDQWSTSAAFLDFDRDGDLDLFVTNYVKWSRDIDLAVDYRLAGIGRAYGPPTNYPGTQSYLYENQDGRRFIDVSEQAGIHIKHPTDGTAIGKGLGVAPVDVDADGWLDLVVANDTVQNFFFHNLLGKFKETGVPAGLAFDNQGAATGAMGIDSARVDGTDRTAIVMGNFANEMSSFYVSENRGELFTDEAVLSGIGPGTRLTLSFGVFFFDYDLDGRLDYLQVGGHIENDINLVQRSQHYQQPAQLYWNCGPDCARSFVAVSAQSLADLGTARVGRGAAYADVDADGDLDVVVTQVGRKPVLLRNDQSLGHHWVRLELVGADRNARRSARLSACTPATPSITGM